MRGIAVLAGLAICGAAIFWLLISGEGNVVGSESIELDTATVAVGTDLNLGNIVYERLEVEKFDKSGTYKVISLSFELDGELLVGYSPGIKYVCAISDGLYTNGFVHYGNRATDNHLEPQFGLSAINEVMRVSGGEPRACEFTLRLRARGSGDPSQRETKPLATLCYQKSKVSLTDGACPEGLIVRKPSSGQLLSARILDVHPVPQSYGDVMMAFGSALTLHAPLPGGKVQVEHKVVCAGTPSTISFGRSHFNDVIPGESIWFQGTAETGTQPADQCSIEVYLTTDEQTTTLAHYCYQAERGVREGGC